ncbi:MAG TPA: hypothetical protein VF691_06085 [Cytophagaceae bacterium]
MAVTLKSMKEKPKRLAPTIKTLRALLAKSGNQCAFPDCNHILIDDENNFVAQVCHIEDALPGGRFNENLNNEKRRQYENLVLLCYRHHVQTNNIERFSASKLRDIKQQHERRFSEPLIVKEATLLNIFNDLKSIKDDTTEIIKNQHAQSKMLEAIYSVISPTSQEASLSTQTSGFLRQIESTSVLIANNRHIAALELLADFRRDNWDRLNGHEKYKLIANLGICHLELGSYDEAASCFIEAGTYDPENGKACGLAALGYSIQGKSQEARKSIGEALAKNPKDPNAYLALINLEKDNQTFDDLLNQIPKELLDTQEISYAIGVLSSYKGDFNTAIYWLQNAVETAVKNKGDLTARLATTILESITNPFNILTGQVNIESKNKINYCIELLTQSWLEFKDSDLCKSRAWILLNRGVAKKYLKDFEGAFDDFKLAAAIEGDNYFTIKHLAILAYELDKLDYSLSLLDQLRNLKSEYEEEFDIDLFEAEVLYKKKEFNHAIDRIKAVLKKTPYEKIKEHALSTLIFAYIAINNFDEAKKVSTTIIEAQPDYLRGYIDASKVCHILGNHQDAVSFLNKAYLKVTPKSSQVDLYELSNEFARNNDYIIAIEILESITDQNIYSELSRTLLKLYFDAGENGKALKLCQSMRSHIGPIDCIAEMQSSIYESIGDLAQAIKVCEEYLEVYPDDQRIQIRLAIIYARNSDTSRVKRILARLKVLGDLPMEILYQLASLNFSVGELQRGLDIAFKTRRKFLNNGDGHLKYIGLMSQYRSLFDYQKPIHVVGIDTVITVQDDLGELLTYYIFDEAENLSKNELLATDPLAKSLIGNRVGFVVGFHRSFGDQQKFEVISIVSKYLYAFRESIELLKTKFVDIQGFRVFNQGSTGDIKQDLKPLFDILDQSENVNKEIYRYYNQENFTIGACAQLSGKTAIEFWSTVFGHPDSGIYSISSVHTEFQAGHLLLDNMAGIIIDLVSLLTLASIKRLELLEMLPNKKALARSSIECINELVTEYKGLSSEGFITVGKVNGEYFKDRVTKETIESNRKHYEALLDWVKSNCTVLPCNEALTMNVSKKVQFDNTIGSAFIDSILIAKEHNFIFLAEEESLRVLALNDFKVKGLPIYVILTYLLEKKTISLESFNEEVARLIKMGIKYLPVSGDILIKCADIAGYLAIYPFDLAIKSLGFSISSEDSSIYVASDFIYKLLNSPINPQVRLNLIVPLFQVLVEGRDFIAVLQKLVALIEIKFKLLQPQKDEFHLIIFEFLKMKSNR